MLQSVSCDTTATVLCQPGHPLASQGPVTTYGCSCSVQISPDQISSSLPLSSLCPLSPSRHWCLPSHFLSYFEQAQGSAAGAAYCFASADVAFVLAYSVIMLNTDLYNDQVGIPQGHST